MKLSVGEGKVRGRQEIGETVVRAIHTDFLDFLGRHAFGS